MAENPKGAGGTWLCPTELDRARLLEMSRLGTPAIAAGFLAAVVPMAMLVDRLGAVVLLPFIVAFAVQGLLIVLAGRARRPELFYFAGEFVNLGALVWVTAFTGGVHSPLIGLFAWPVLTASARFNVRGAAVVIVGCTLAPIASALFAVDRGNTLDALLLPSAIMIVGGIGAMVLATTRAERHYRSQSLLDPLTGLLNRLALEQRFGELCGQAAVSDGDLCLIAADLDNFKLVNDAHGHDQGDVVLRDVAYAMRTSTRSFSLLYRVGGEEFVILLPGLDADEGAAVAERLREAVAGCRPAGIEVTMSFGVASARGVDVEFASLFNAADARLYSAKRLGRNRVVTADDQASEAFALA